MRTTVTGGSDKEAFEKTEPMKESMLEGNHCMWRASSWMSTNRPKLKAAALAVCLFKHSICNVLNARTQHVQPRPRL